MSGTSGGGPDPLEPMPLTRVRLRGALAVRRGDTEVRLRPKERAVLAAIALAHPHPISTDRIIALVWGEEPPATARKAVHNHVARIRGVADDLIVTEGDAYRFAAHVEADTDPSATGNEVLLADLVDTPEVAAHRQRLQSTIAAQEERRLDEEHRGDVDPGLLDRLYGAVIDEPYREHRWCLLASAQARIGDRRDALRTCATARRRLAEVGLLPGTELIELEQRILADGTDGHSGAAPDDRGRPASAARPMEPGPMEPGPMEPRVVQLHPHRHDAFVGRSAELDALDRIWRSVRRRRRPELALVQGPAGMGKTRLADEFIRRAMSAGDDIRIVWGRNRPDPDRAYSIVADVATRVLDLEPDLIDALGDRLAPLLSLTHYRDAADTDDIAVPVDAHGSLARALSLLLDRLAERPTVLFIDDLQWASPDSVRVIEEAIDGMSAQLMIVITTRSLGQAVSGDVARLSRVVPTTSLMLTGLSIGEVAELLSASATRVGPDEALATAIHERTAGLPLFASEIARVARVSGAVIDPTTIPVAIRDWVEHRVRALEPASAEVLQAAAVIGVEVDATLVADVLGIELPAVIAHCDELVSAGLFTVDPDSGNLRFSHEVTRDIIVDSVGPTVRAHLHGRAAACLERRAAPPGRLANHYAEAGPEYGDRVVEHAVDAGRRALAVGEWTRAERWFGLGLEHATTGEQHAVAGVGRGRALLGAERFDDAAATLRESIDIALVEGLPLAHAEGALALAGRAGRGAVLGDANRDIIATLRGALAHVERCDPGDDRHYTIARAELERELAISMFFEDAEEQREKLLNGAVARVRSLDPPDHRALAGALNGARYAGLRPEGFGQRIADNDEVLALPTREVGPHQLLAAHTYRYEDRLRCGQRDHATTALADAEAFARRYPDPYWMWAIRTWRGLEHVVHGDLGSAEEIALDAFSSRADIAEVQACLGVNLINIRLYQGRVDEVIDALATAVEEHPEIPAYRAVLALCAIDAGDGALAAEILGHFVERECRDLPNDTNRFLALVVLAHAAAGLGCARSAKVLLPLLDPYRGQWAVLSCYGGGGATWGPVDHARALLAAVVGDASEATALLDAATDQAAGSPPALTRIAADRLNFELA